MLGHACAAMTLDLYGHLLANDLDTMGARLDAARAAALTEQGRNEASETVISLPVRRHT